MGPPLSKPRKSTFFKLTALVWIVAASTLSFRGHEEFVDTGSDLEQIRSKIDSATFKTAEPIVRELEQLESQLKSEIKTTDSELEVAIKKYDEAFNVLEKWFSPKADACHADEIQPKEKKSKLQKARLAKVQEYLEEARVLASTIEWKESLRTGVAGVFNPETQRVEWKENFRGGVAGVYNPSTQKIEWRESHRSGVAVVYKGAPTATPYASSSGFCGDDE